MACGFQSGEGWDQNEGYIEGEAGFWLEEVAINGIIGYIENKSTSNNVHFLLLILYANIDDDNSLIIAAEYLCYQGPRSQECDRFIS
jgi:hypothetical protein